MDNLMSKVRDWLKVSQNIAAPLDWLQACIEWIHDEHGQSIRDSISDINNLVLEQWLLSDLTETGAACLPGDILQHKKYQLIGAFCLQINSVVDISCSYYSQLQKVQGTENENEHVSATQFPKSQSENNSNRMLMMDLTDGTTNVKGMEYNHIPGLNVNVKLGTKIVVHGEVLCRLGVLMLKGCNVRILGGEVDSLTATQEELLKTALNKNEELKENPQRREFKGSGNFLKKQAGENSVPRSNNRQNFGTQKSQFHQKSQNMGFLSPTAAPQRCQNPSTNMDIDWEDDLDDDIFMDQALMSEPKLRTTVPVNNSMLPFNLPSVIENPVNRHSVSNMSNFNRSSKQNVAIVDNQESRYNHKHQKQDDVNNQKSNRSNSYMLNNNRPSSSNNLEYTLSSSSIFPVESNQSINNNRIKRKNSNDMFKSESKIIKQENNEDWDIDQEFSLDSILADVQTEQQVNIIKTEPVKVEPVMVRHPSFRYLIELKEKPERQKCIKVKAYISTLLGKLDFNNGKFWSLLVKVNDGTHSEEVDISDHVLCKLIGYSAEQCLNVKKSGTKADKVKLSCGLKQCQAYLIEMSAVFELEFGGILNRPCMKDIFDINEDHKEYFTVQKIC